MGIDSEENVGYYNDLTNIITHNIKLSDLDNVLKIRGASQILGIKKTTNFLGENVGLVGITDNSVIDAHINNGSKWTVIEEPGLVDSEKIKKGEFLIIKGLDDRIIMYLSHYDINDIYLEKWHFILELNDILIIIQNDPDKSPLINIFKIIEEPQISGNTTIIILEKLSTNFILKLIFIMLLNQSENL